MTAPDAEHGPGAAGPPARAAAVAVPGRFRAGCRAAAVAVPGRFRAGCRAAAVAVPGRFRAGCRAAAVTLAATLAAGCAWYSFSGATIPSHLSTIAVPLAEDRSVSTVAGLDERMTSLLVGRFIGQTRLSLEPVESEADAVLRVTIDAYRNQPTSVGGQERATRNRVTLTVSVVYTDQVQDRELLRRAFTSFEEYDALDPSLEEEAALAALEKIADDVFTAATSNW